MTAVRELLRFYVDESALGLGHALESARHDVAYAGHPLMPAECRLGARDTEWIPAVAAMDLVVIIRDKGIRKKPVEVRAYDAVGLRVLALGGRQDAGIWGWLTWLVRQWATIEAVIAHEGRGPWLYVVNAGGMARVNLPPP